MYCVRNVPRSAKSLALGEDNRLTSTVKSTLTLVLCRSRLVVEISSPLSNDKSAMLTVLSSAGILPMTRPARFFT